MRTARALVRTENLPVFDKMISFIWIFLLAQVKGQSNRCPSGVDQTGTDAFCCRNESSKYAPILDSGIAVKPGKGNRVKGRVYGIASDDLNSDRLNIFDKFKKETWM